MKRAAFVLCILLAAGMPPNAAPQSTAGGVEDAPWWDDDRNVGEGNFRDGWNMRIPLELHEAHAVREGTAVQVHLDLARSMMAGGWPGRDDVPASFHAYPESVRLVEYDDWGTIRGEVPFRLYDTWLEADQLESQYVKEQTGDFHGQRNPVATLEWRLPRDLDADDTHRYFVYFDIEQNAGATQEHRKSAPELQPQEREHLDGLYWVGAGTMFYGYYPHSTTQNTMTVFAAGNENPPVPVNVKVYAGTASTERLDDRRSDKDRDEGTEIQGPNPEFCLLCPDNPGGAKSYPFGFNPTHFRVEADRPIVVMTHRLDSVSPGPDTTPVPEFVPSREGSTLGWTFDVPEVTGSVFVIKPPGGKAQIAVTGAPSSGCGGQLGHPVQVNFCRINFGIDADNQNVANVRTITATGDPVMVQFLPRGATGHPAQVPSAMGSPVGSTFHAATVSDNCRNGASGGFQLTAWERHAFVDIEDRTTNPATNIRHAVEIANEPPAPQRVPGNGLQIQNCVPAPGQPTWNTPLPYTTEAVADPDTGETTGPIQVRAGQFGGSPIAQTTPFGGRHGTDFHVQGPFVIYNYYATTDLEITTHTGDAAGTEHRTAGPLGTPIEYDAGRNDVTSITADKPVSVFPLGTPSNYARFHAAGPAFIEPHILPGQYRGYLFDVSPQDGVDPVFATGLPGQSLDSTFQVQNLARWEGQTLSDKVRLSATVESRNWNGAASVGVGFDEQEMVLQDDERHNNRLTIDLPGEVPSDTQITVRVTAVSEGNPQMTQSFSVVVLVRQTFDVDLWFGEPTSVSGAREKPLRVQAGAEEAVPFVIRNEGSGADDFQITFGEPGGGWDVHVTDTSGLPLSRVEGLEPEAQVGAVLHVRAPLTQELTAVTIPIDAVSETSPLASDRIILSASLALAQDLRLEAKALSHTIAPGTTQRFDVLLNNTGEDGLSVRMAAEADLPPGWSLTFAGLGDPDEPPISMQPGQTVKVSLDLSAPDDASANDFVSFLLRAEGLGEGVEARDAVSLSATVGTSHELIPETVPDLKVVPGIPKELEVTVRNDGNGPDAVRIEPATVPGGWIVPPTDDMVIGPGDSATFTVVVEAPKDAAPGSVDLVLAARGSGQAFPFLATARVQETHEIAWRQHAPVIAQPRDIQDAVVYIENLGNTPERISLEASAPWPVRLDADQIDVPADGVRAVGIAWDTGDVETEDVIRVTARAESGATEVLDLPVRVVAPRLDADEVVQTSAPRGPGSVGTVMVVMRNPGEAPVRDAEVRLVAEQDVVLEAVAFKSVGANGTAVASLRWTAGPDATPERIEWGHWLEGEFHVLGTAPVPEYTPPDDRSVPLTPLLVLVALIAAALRRRGGAA